MSLSPRILFVTESFGVGGTETHLLALLPSLRAHGFEVKAFCFTERGRRAELLDSAGIEVVAPPRSSIKNKRSLQGLLQIGRSSTGLFTLLRRWQPSIVHFFLPGPYLVGAPIAIAAGVPIKLMSRRSLADYRSRWPMTARLEQVLHRQMDRVLGNSRAVVQELMREGCSPEQVHLIYNGVQLKQLCEDQAEARLRLGVDAASFVMVMVANLFPYKGHRELIDALAMITDRLPRPWILLCAGRTDCGDGLRQHIDEIGLTGNVRLLGERFDVPRILRAADISVLTPVRNEGFSNAVLESMAAGLPMIVTDIGGNAEAVVDEETGFVVHSGDLAALGNAILKLAYDSDLRRSMGERARKRVAEHFSLVSCFESYCDLYQQLLLRQPR
jgi:glycosyltransferase involved in cell wall biosynthesis